MIDETSDEQNLIQFLRDTIIDYSVSGLLLGKRSRAQELGVNLIIDERSYLSEIMEGFSGGDLVTIIGNLIDNAMESFQEKEEREKHVHCLIQGGSTSLSILIEDNGKGMTEQEQEQIFQYGFSTKATEGRGIGLALIKQIVEAHHGKINVRSTLGEGSTIQIKIGKRGIINID